MTNFICRFGCPAFFVPISFEFDELRSLLCAFEKSVSPNHFGTGVFVSIRGNVGRAGFRTSSNLLHLLSRNETKL